MSILPNSHSTGTADFACAQAGCQTCMQALLHEHEGLVHACIHYAEIGGVAYAEVAQEGRVGLWRAILHYDPARQVAFSTYAWRRIWGCIWRYATRFSQKGEAWEEEPYEACQAELAEAAWEQAQIAMVLREAVEVLPDRLRQVVEQYYGLEGQPPLTLEAVGCNMGLTRERVRQLRNEALGLLRLPALSTQLRQLCERDSRKAYRQARQDTDAWLRRRRGIQ